MKLIVQENDYNEIVAKVDEEIICYGVSKFGWKPSLTIYDENGQIIMTLKHKGFILYKLFPETVIDEKIDKIQKQFPNKLNLKNYVLSIRHQILRRKLYINETLIGRLKSKTSWYNNMSIEIDEAFQDYLKYIAVLMIIYIYEDDNGSSD